MARRYEINENTPFPTEIKIGEILEEELLDTTWVYTVKEIHDSLTLEGRVFLMENAQNGNFWWAPDGKHGTMPAKFAAEQYLKGYYHRPDGIDRKWEEYREEDLARFVPVWEDVEKRGCEFLQVDHVYSPTMTLLVIVHLRLAVYLRDIDSGASVVSDDWPGWMQEFFWTLENDEQHNEFQIFDDAMDGGLVKFVINECC